MPEEQKQPENNLEKYIHEIDICGNPVVQKLSEVMGKDNIARYLSHLYKHDSLAEPNTTDTIQTGSVLCGDDIISYCEHTVPLIDYPLKDYVRIIESASYQLRLGSRCRVVDEKGKDKTVWLHDSQKILRIPPHGIAIVSTYEWLNIPGSLIGRWNLKVKKVYEGLVWVGSLQVDPGYQGFLFCPIYNLSSEPRDLIYKDPLFTIDFVRTTPGKDGKYKIWSLPTNKFSLFDFDRLDEKKIKSAPQESFRKYDTQIENIVNQTEEIKEKLDNKIETYSQVMLVLISVIIAALAIISTFGLTTIDWSFIDGKGTTFVIASFVFSIFAIVFACMAMRRKK